LKQSGQVQLPDDAPTRLAALTARVPGHPRAAPFDRQVPPFKGQGAGKTGQYSRKQKYGGEFMIRGGEGRKAKCSLSGRKAAL